jgi:hypothetical protein
MSEEIVKKTYFKAIVLFLVFLQAGVKDERCTIREYFHCEAGPIPHIPQAFRIVVKLHINACGRWMINGMIVYWLQEVYHGNSVRIMS